MTLLAAVGCQTGAEPTDQIAQGIAHPGPWQIPEETLAIGDGQDVDYTGAGPWIGEEGCAPGIKSGTDILRDYLYAHFPQTNLIGGYDCRPIVGNESQMSVHGTGRALDIMIPTDGGEADNDAGDAIGNWLIENAEAIGIQLIIWDLYTWQAARAPGEKGKDYGGQHPHHDHLHIELSVEHADETENWFEDLVEPPGIEGCQPLAFGGGTIDDANDCFMLFGDPDFWRKETGVGHDGGLYWTNAWQNDEPSNWARWNFSFSARGLYEVEVYIDPAWGVHSETRYALRFGDQEQEVILDQAAQSGWVSLGQFEFEPGGDQHLSVFDNALGPVAEEQHIAADAARLTRIGEYEPPDGREDGSAEGEDGGTPPTSAPPDTEADGGGCAVADEPARRGVVWAVPLLLAGLWRAFKRERSRA